MERGRKQFAEMMVDCANVLIIVLMAEILASNNV